jgi:hypothetical protein
MTAEEHLRITDEHTRQIAMLLEHGQTEEARTNERFTTLLEHGQEVNRFLNRIAEAELRLAEAQNRHEEAQNRLEFAQAETTEKLNALIAIVDEIARGRGNGKEG